MNAQELIDACDEKTDLLELFYPEMYKMKLADRNITKILRDLK